MSYFKVSYGSFKLVIIQAGSHKEAAIKYFNLFPCNEDKWITVLKKGFRSRKNVMMYRSSELFADQIKIESGNKNFKESKLDSYLIKLYKLVKNSKPEWLNNIWNSEDDKCDLKSGLIISIPNPFQKYHPLHISTEDIESNLISFGFAWTDWYDLRYYSNLSWSEWNRNIEAVYKTIVDFVTAIIEEELICTNANYTKGLGSVNGIFLTKEAYKMTMEQDTLLQAISWKGTYNYSKFD